MGQKSVYICDNCGAETNLGTPDINWITVNRLSKPKSSTNMGVAWQELHDYLEQEKTFCGWGCLYFHAELHLRVR